jgi:3-oxoacyl-[acyl-carrier-protein] synthase III
MGNVIVGTGSYLPGRVVTNEDLLHYVDLSRYDAQRSGPYPQ